MNHRTLFILNRIELPHAASHTNPKLFHRIGRFQTMGKASGKRKRSGAAPAALSAALSNRKKRKREADVSADASPPLPAAVGALRALRTRADAVVDALEWLGDAVLGELVGRCLLAQFRAAAPLSARVFRNLRLAAVSNRNLARAFHLMGYGSFHRQQQPELKLKDKADVVEAVVGELALRRALSSRLDKPRGAVNQEQGELVSHLDALLATVLRAHFDDRVRWRQQKQQSDASAAPLVVAFNPFACLPEEQLDESSGELVVREVAPEFELHEDDHNDTSSVADLVHEYAVSREGDDATRHHAFPEPLDDTDDAPTDAWDASIHARTRRAMRHVQAADHILRASREVFEVFKIYGMAVLTERVSLALALPRLARLDRLSPASLDTSPSELTHARQRVLSVANLADCATALGIASPLVTESVDGEADDERLRANTLRAFVGYHSAMATASAAPSPSPSLSSSSQSNELVNDICQYLQVMSPGLHSAGDNTRSGTSVKLPPREPLVALMLAVSEARTFMRSKTCDELHTPGERLPPLKAPKKTFLLRHCDSNEVEDLFEVLARDVERQEQAQQRRAEEKARTSRRPKRAKVRADASQQQQGQLATLERFLHRRFLFCLEELIVLFAQRKTDECRSKMALFQHDLEPCVEPERFRKWEVSTSTLTLAMRDSFYRLLLHDLSQFHAVVSSSKNTRDGTRITQLRLPLHYTWAKSVGKRLTDEARANC